MVKYWLTLLVGMGIGSIVFAEEPEETPTLGTAALQNDSERRDDSRWRGNEATKNITESYQKVDAILKEKFPAEYAEIEKLRQTDRRAAFEQKRELATKAGIEMPTFGSGRTTRNSEQPTVELPPSPTPTLPKDDKLTEWQKLETPLKEKYPLEFAEYEKLRQTDRPAALIKLKELADKEKLTLPPEEGFKNKVLPRDLARLMVERAESILCQRYPEEYKEIEKTRGEDPDAAREKFRELAKKAGLGYEELKRQISTPPSAMRATQAGTTLPSQAQSQDRNQDDGNPDEIAEIPQEF